MDFVETIREKARARPRRIVFPEGDDERTLEAVAEIQRRDLLRPVLLGDPEAVSEGLRAWGGDPGGAEIRDPRSLEDVDRYQATLLERRRGRGMTAADARERARDPLFRGALMVRLGEADGSVAGAVHSTGDVLRAAIWCVGPAQGIRTVSSAFYMVTPPFRGDGPEVLTFTDCAVVPEPDGDQLAQIASAAAQARRKVVGDPPVVAFLSYSTRGSAEGPSVVKVREAVARFHDMEPGVPADGELQVDVALTREVARRKVQRSQVMGDANVLVFPDLDAGNIAYKLTQRLAGAQALGPIIQGLDRPCNDLSRGAAPTDIVDVACITSLMA